MYNLLIKICTGSLVKLLSSCCWKQALVLCCDQFFAVMNHFAFAETIRSLPIAIYSNSMHGCYYASGIFTLFADSKLSIGATDLDFEIMYKLILAI